MTQISTVKATGGFQVLFIVMIALKSSTVDETSANIPNSWILNVRELLNKVTHLSDSIKRLDSYLVRDVTYQSEVVPEFFPHHPEFYNTLTG